ncbi:cytochrome oxidase c subunit VIb-domain-containing protein [Globomyces pollinis-pini]|nr:cytochrome oxidase c subunit VIb-domain-containing protein [Globomyces pollinis-pini]
MSLKPPSKSSRKDCWNARDAYFKCLDDNGLWLNGLLPESHNDIIQLDPLHLNNHIKQNNNTLSKKQKDTLFVCDHLNQLYNNNCLPSWVYHFAALRVQEKQKNYLQNQLKEKSKLHQSDDFWSNVQQK